MEDFVGYLGIWGFVLRAVRSHKRMSQRKDPIFCHLAIDEKET